MDERRNKPAKRNNAELDELCIGYDYAGIDLKSIGCKETLIASLLHERAYSHPADNIQLLETHISWVILTGNFAYKIKKPIKLEFLDFSSLERRKKFCDEELRLNRRWAPELYLDVVPICGSLEKPVVGGTGIAIEYAVKMLQFPQVAQLDAQLDAGLLVDADMIELAEMIAAHHGMAAVIEQRDAKDAIESIRHPMLENVEHLKPYVSRDVLQGLSAWTISNLQVLRTALVQRQRDGFIRVCHGDLHLRNLVRLPAGIVAFDCVEFSAELRNVDVISDVSFLVMDLIARKRRDLAYVFINRYLECTGDYAGMAVFGLYYVYHALIRAKVAAIRSVERTDEIVGQDGSEEIAHCCSVARHWTVSRQPFLIAMHGFSGSGKTSLSQILISRLPAIRVRSDIERKRAYGFEETEHSGARVGKGIYDPHARRNIYETLAAAAEVSLRLGQNVIVDAAFLNCEDRQHFRTLAKRLNADFLIVDTCAEPDELRRRVQLRQRDAGDASEADANVLQYQFEHAEPLSSKELEWTVTVATDTDIDVGAVVEQIGAAIRRPPSI
jgi:aminoglycoside phosphotransferase family enzyme/predicted kinase